MVVSENEQQYPSLDGITENSFIVSELNQKMLRLIREIEEFNRFSIHYPKILEAADPLSVSVLHDMLQG